MRLEKLTDKWAEMSAHGTFCQVVYVCLYVVVYVCLHKFY